MITRNTLLAAAASVMLLVTASGCSDTRDTRDPEIASAYADAAITTAVKIRFVDNKDVDALSIQVETLGGTVMLSGFAKSPAEKATAESETRKVDGVKFVKNQITVRP